MNSEFFVSYGCYVGYENVHVVVAHNENMSEQDIMDYLCEEFHPRALEVCESYYGLHGFEAEDEDDEEAMVEYIEEHAEVSVEQWDEVEHLGSVTHGNSVDSESYEIL